MSSSFIWEIVKNSTVEKIESPIKTVEITNGPIKTKVETITTSELVNGCYDGINIQKSNYISNSIFLSFNKNNYNSDELAKIIEHLRKTYCWMKDNGM